MRSPILFKYDGNIRRILWNCSSPEAKFRSSDCCAKAGTENRQARKQARYTRSILVLLTAGCTILKRAAHDHANVQRFDKQLASMRLQFDQILDPDRLTAAFDAPIG